MRSYRWWLGLTLAAAVLFPALWTWPDSLTNWDDSQLIAGSPLVASRTFSTFIHSLSLVQPASLPTRNVYNGLIILLAGPDVHAFRIAAILLSLILAAILWGLFRALGWSERWALGGVMVILLHPLRVESWAWASGQKDLLAFTLLWGGVLLMLRASESPLKHRTGWGLWVLSLAAKPNGLFMPLLRVFPTSLESQTQRWKGLRRWLGPLGLVLSCGVALGLGLRGGASNANLWVSSTQPIWFLGWAVNHILYPFDLVPSYPRPESIGELWLPLLSGTIGWVLLSLLMRRKDTLAFWAAATVLGGVLIGSLSSLPTPLADRYALWVLPGIVGLIGSAILYLETRIPILRTGLHLLLALLIGGLAGLGVRQAEVWKSSRTLWEYTLSVYPHHPLAEWNFGVDLLESGDHIAALPHLEQAGRYFKKDPRVLRPMAECMVLNGLQEKALPILLTLYQDGNTRDLRLIGTLERCYDDLGDSLRAGYFRKIGRDMLTARKVGSSSKIEYPKTP